MIALDIINCEIKIEGIYTPFILIPNDRFEIIKGLENYYYLDFEGYHVRVEQNEIKDKYKIYYEKENLKWMY